MTGKKWYIAIGLSLTILTGLVWGATVAYDSYIAESKYEKNLDKNLASINANDSIINKAEETLYTLEKQDSLKNAMVNSDNDPEKIKALQIEIDKINSELLNARENAVQEVKYVNVYKTIYQPDVNQQKIIDSLHNVILAYRVEINTLSEIVKKAEMYSDMAKMAEMNAIKAKHLAELSKEEAMLLNESDRILFDSIIANQPKFDTISIVMVDTIYKEVIMIDTLFIKEESKIKKIKKKYF